MARHVHQQPLAVAAEALSKTTSDVGVVRVQRHSAARFLERSVAVLHVRVRVPRVADRDIRCWSNLLYHPFKRRHAVSPRFLQVDVRESLDNCWEHLRHVRRSEGDDKEDLARRVVLISEGRRVLLNRFENRQLVLQAELPESGLVFVLGRSRGSQPRVHDRLHPAHASHVPLDNIQRMIPAHRPPGNSQT